LVGEEETPPSSSHPQDRLPLASFSWWNQVCLKPSISLIW